METELQKLFKSMLLQQVLELNKILMLMFFYILNCTYMHSVQAECKIEIDFVCLMFLKFQKHDVFPTLILGVMGLKITTLSQEPVNGIPIVK